ncbi:MAG: hypothetical protein ACI83B_002657, partial [Sediminicola sp.]
PVVTDEVRLSHHLPYERYARYFRTLVLTTITGGS